MATWHQQRHPVKLYHEEMWTVVTDPPNKLRICSHFYTALGAEEFLQILRERSAEEAMYSYILPPACAFEKENSDG